MSSKVDSTSRSTNGRLDRALGVKPYSNSSTDQTKMAVRNTQYILRRRERAGTIKLIIVVAVMGLLCGIVLHETAATCKASPNCVLKD